jgi:hypothetical protein
MLLTPGTLRRWHSDLVKRQHSYSTTDEDGSYQRGGFEDEADEDTDEHTLEQFIGDLPEKVQQPSAVSSR